MEETSRKTVSRRQLMKALAATGGVVAASTLLPNKWAKPSVQVGLLPVHAQVTGAILACMGDPDGGVPGEVPQGGWVHVPRAQCNSLVPEGTWVCLEVTADPDPGGSPWYKESQTTDCTAAAEVQSGECLDNTAFFPCFRVPGDAPIGTEITFTFTFCDDDEFGHDSCSFVVAVVAGGGNDESGAAAEWGFGSH